MSFLQRRRRGLFIALAALAVLAGAGPATAQAPAASAPPSLETIAGQLEKIETAVQRPELGDSDLDGYRLQIVPLRDQLRERIEELSPRFAEADTRLKQLGPAPAEDAPAEEPAIAAERARLQKIFSETDANLKQARLLVLRTDQLTARVNEQRRALFTRELFTRRASVLSQGLWSSAAAAIPDHARNIAEILHSWRSFVVNNSTSTGAGLVAAIFIAAGAVVLFLRRWSGRLVHPHSASRFSLSASALIVFAREAATMPLLLLILMAALERFNLTSPRVSTIGFGLVGAVAIASVGRAVARALLAPEAADHRLFAIDERIGRLTAGHLIWGARILGIASLLTILDQVALAPVAVTVATSATLAVINAALVAHLLLRLPRAGEDGGYSGEVRLQWLRSLAWAFVIAIAIALLGGYIGFAAFLAGRLIAAATVCGLLAICLVFIDSVFSEVITGDSPRGRAMAGMFGLSPRGVELIGTVLSAAIRILLVLIAIVPLIGPWSIFASDFFTSLRDAMFGFKVGDLTISPSMIASALALFLIGAGVVRLIQRWMSRKLLPRAGMEPGLQHSISTLFGYAGFIAVIALVLGQIGIDLQKIALVAGALSVGIGFGLQSIVSNFVSGLILLAERPFRVGDWVVVKGEEGYVRRISVRATEIETFERAAIIVPNSEFITSVVKNWTHGNTIGRITVKVGVAYDSDPDQVRALLLACAEENPQVLRTPPAQALLVSFGDSALNFELRCYLANVGYVPVVRSDLHVAILKRFHSAGIEIPYPQSELRWRGPGPAPLKAE